MWGKYLIVAAMSLSSFSFAAEKEARVVGGSDATISQAPWQAFVRIGNNFCGGVIISDFWILTAAHCLDTAGSDDPFSLASASSVTVYTGTAETFNANFSDFLSEVDAVYVHGGYSKDSLENDIALVKLSSSVHANASSVVLADTSVQANVDATGNQGLGDLRLSGWGFTDTGRTTSTNTLQIASLSTVLDSTCASAWGATVSGVSSYQNKFFCAQESNVGACNGDSGGPLIWMDPNRASDADNGATLVGIVSFGVNAQCASSTFPDVYTQVSNYSDWIGACQAGNCVNSSSNTVSGGGGGGAIHYYLSVFLLLILMLRRESTRFSPVLKRGM
ncbi:serine endopeptidase [Enterovibrio norvegicus]|uniref:Trypsin n=1 Tax=Enterovibrio norvegicus DSM 15893 TaxID=1121869 RepID=A0A1I5V8G7_9GAMM|nr:serine protease [Enterovibrio norvegicus]OEF64069.1 serine endopeptidase [Enterovibrio norvegicus]SFQ03813.1 Trypsin [Enterovibrio norvegicus DSM 15893]